MCLGCKNPQLLIREVCADVQRRRLLAIGSVQNHTLLTIVHFSAKKKVPTQDQEPNEFLWYWKNVPGSRKVCPVAVVLMWICRSLKKSWKCDFCLKLLRISSFFIQKSTCVRAGSKTAPGILALWLLMRHTVKSTWNEVCLICKMFPGSWYVCIVIPVSFLVIMWLSYELWLVSCS